MMKRLGIALMMVGVLAGCGRREMEARANTAAQNAENSATRAEAAARRAEQAVGRAEAAMQRAEAIVAKAEESHHGRRR